MNTSWKKQKNSHTLNFLVNFFLKVFQRNLLPYTEMSVLLHLYTIIDRVTLVI